VTFILTWSEKRASGHRWMLSCRLNGSCPREKMLMIRIYRNGKAGEHYVAWIQDGEYDFRKFPNKERAWEFAFHKAKRLGPLDLRGLHRRLRKDGR
jgi:hypothetical protein